MKPIVIATIDSAALRHNLAAVRRRAVQALGEKGANVVNVLGKVIDSERPAEAKRNAVWIW